MRRRILTALCEGERTTSELAQHFGISGTAVREHLRVLAEDGFVQHRIERRGVGKPKHVFALTESGDVELSRAYAPVLSALGDALVTQLGEPEFRAVLRAAGRGLASGRRREGTTSPVASAVALLEDLGAAAVVEERGGVVTVRGACCPLAALTAKQPMFCELVEAALRDVTGVAVRESCERSRPPHCRFEIMVR